MAGRAFTHRMPRYTLGQLETLKRKDLIALCKENEIKCVGKNSELIEKLLELTEDCTQQLDTEAKAINGNLEVCLEETAPLGNTTAREDANGGETVAGDTSEVPTAAVEDSTESATSEESGAKVDQVTTEITTAEHKNTVPDIGGKQTDGSNESIIKEIPELQKECPVKVCFAEDQPQQQSPCAQEQHPPSPQVRRLSARLLAAHLKRNLDSPRPKPSSLNRTKVLAKVLTHIFPLESSIPKPVAVQKENARPALFSKNISHIPTLKERVSKLSSMPSVMKRPAATATVAKRPKYDPKESLKKPLPYKPYTGPLKKQLS